MDLSNLLRVGFVSNYGWFKVLIDGWFSLSICGWPGIYFRVGLTCLFKALT